MSVNAAGVLTERFAMQCIAFLLLLYVSSFALTYPTAITNTDETGYLHQAQMMLRGTFTLTQIDPISGDETTIRPGTYPPGTALLMAPLIALFGWRGAFVIPVLSVVLATLWCARWLRDEGRSPLFALLLLGFAPTLVTGRLAMSDAPSAAFVALGLWLFWRGLDRGALWWLAAGFVAGSSLTLRPTNPIVFAPLFAGTVLRRDKNVWALVVGGLVGVGACLAATQWVFGDPFYARTSYDPDIANFHERFALYSLGLLILVPGGLVFALAYRGRRRPEVIASFISFVVFYLAQEYSTHGTGTVKRIVLALRYLVPIVPLVVFAMAESVPRIWGAALARRSGQARDRLERWVRRGVAAAVASLAIACLLVHPVYAAWASTQAEIRDQIRRYVPVDEVYITNWAATRKFIPELEEKYTYIDVSKIEPSDVPQLAERYGQVFLVLLNRSDSEVWLRDARANSEFVGALAPAPELLLDQQMSSTDHLRIWKLTRAVVSTRTP
jgi:4-amino-4-deoxy-L-arabinose transferase-like glycosyltransferase